jgi:hypothetical protein
MLRFAQNDILAEFWFLLATIFTIILQERERIMAKKEKKEKKEKPLDRMTATELRKYALDMGEITGVHGMNKEELLSAIKKVKGIVDEGKVVKTVNMRELKQKVKELRGLKAAAYEAGESNQKVNILRRRMNRLKKRTRKAA